MSDREWEDMQDTELDALLEDAVPDLPPEDIVARVTPWKQAINRVLAGMALTAITLNFWGLNYILPAVGTVLQLLGFRALRRENGWFKCCFGVAVLRTAYFLPSLILNTMIIQSAVYASAVGSVLTVANLLLTFVLIVGLWGGFRAVQRKAGLPPHAGGAAALFVWYALMCLLALVEYSGLLLGGLLILTYFLILCSLRKLSKELDEAGYAIRTAPVRVTDRCIAGTLLAALLAGMACGYVLGGSYPMEWVHRSSADVEHHQVEDIKAWLKALGFPGYVLDDLTAEDIAACEGAERVVVDVSADPMEVGEGDKKHRNNASQETILAVEGLRSTGVGVQAPGPDGRDHWIIFHHFLWTADPRFYGTESIQLWPVYRDVPQGWRCAGEVTGRVLYDGATGTYTADYYFLGDQTYTSSSIFGGSQNSVDVFAAFSMPRDGHNCRGYVAYPVDAVQEGYIINSWCNYTHQQSWMQYPAMTAMETRIKSFWTSAGVFETTQDALQFFPTDTQPIS